TTTRCKQPSPSPSQRERRPLYEPSVSTPINSFTLPVRLRRPGRLFALKRKDYLPIIFHADDSPTVLLRLVIKRLRECADFRVGQSLSGAVRILALGVVV